MFVSAIDCIILSGFMIILLIWESVKTKYFFYNSFLKEEKI